MVCPGFRHEIDGVPDWLAPYWEDDFSTLHSPAWWRQLWEESGLVSVDRVELLPRGAEEWLLWAEACDDWARITGGEPFFEQEAEMLRADVDGLLGFVAVVATKTCP